MNFRASWNPHGELARGRRHGAVTGERLEGAQSGQGRRGVGGHVIQAHRKQPV